MIVDPIPDILEPAAKLLPHLDSAKARVLLLAIALQESRFEHRRQIQGPAVSFWQFERGGGIRGVLQFRTTAIDAVKVCHAVGCGSSTQEVYERMITDDILGACFARLLLYTDPHPLPLIGDVEGSWGYYLNNWRPGKPHRHTWDEQYAKALDLVGRA